MFDPSLVAPERIRALSRKEYDRMVELGMFEDEKIELLRGLLVTMSPQNWPHSAAVQWLTKQLALQIDRSLAVRPQLPFAASNDSEPEPDLAIVREDYTLRDHPSEVLLLIEVADSSLRKDRSIKRAIYAENGVPEYWIVDVATMTVEVYTQPVNGDYASVRVARDGDVLEPLLLAGVSIAVAELPR
ncbi:MAG: Uma2 family endonuclease [Kofleriaceae bacterium]